VEHLNVHGAASVILQLGTRDFSVLAWVRDKDGEPVYRMVKDRIKAATPAATIARDACSKAA
jgi:hypothetical protein